MKERKLYIGKKKINFSGIKEKTSADVDKEIKKMAKVKAAQEDVTLSEKIEQLLYDYVTR
jgi:hypothetical protein